MSTVSTQITSSGSAVLTLKGSKRYLSVFERALKAYVTRTGIGCEAYVSGLEKRFLRTQVTYTVEINARVSLRMHVTDILQLAGA